MVRLLSFLTNEFIIEDPRGWGAERRLRALTKGMRAEDVDLVGVGYTEIAKRFPEGIDYAIPRNRRFSLARLVFAGVHLMRRLRCDGLYAYHSDSVHVLLPTFLVALVCRKPYFVVVHDDAKRKEDSGTLTELSRAELTDRRKRFPRNVVYLAFDVLRRVAIRRATTCICVSNFSAKYATDVLHVKRVAVTGNGVERRWFGPDPETKQYAAAFMGRVERGKGVDTLLLAWSRVISREPGANLVLIGSLDPAEGEYLDRIVEQYHLEKNVKFAGYSSDAEAEELIRASRIFVLPSRKEGFGLSVVEAMAAGVPCIVSDIPALVENFQRAASVFPVEDSAALTEAILALLDDPALSAHLAEEGRKLAASLTWDSVCAKEAGVIKRNMPRAGHVGLAATGPKR